MPSKRHPGEAKVLKARKETLELFADRGMRPEQIAQKMGCALTTVYRRLDKALAELSTSAQRYADHGRELSTGRITKWIGRLEERADADPCEECGRGAATNTEIASFAEKIKGLESRLARLWGLDEPAAVVVATRAREGVDDLARLVREAILEEAPSVAEAARYLLAIEKKIRIANGEMDVEVSPEAVARAIGSGKEQGEVN